tara:strand:+ start:188 stop:1450 length:1263 start_codon:yes stop_codon:yes gene_type:complete
MSFTKDSEKLIKEFINDFDKYCYKRTSRIQKTTDTILKSIYNDIRLSHSYVDLMEAKDVIKVDTKEIKTLRELPKSDLMDSSFIPSQIKDDILYNILGYMKMSITINKINVNIFYGIFDKKEFNKLEKIKNSLLEAVTIIKFCSLYSNLKSMKSLDIYLYLTDKAKILPNNPVLVLGPNNCNSAVTFACAEKGKLMIYRKEEWKKVLIHELFHSLCLDFSGIKYDSLRTKMKKVFDVQSDFEISESYSEFWATILNSCFISFKLLDKPDDVENFLLFTDFCIQLERIFSLFQMIKILHFMGLRYENLFKADSISVSFRNILYKEDTNVLAYYIIKTILLFYHDDFLKWCLINNNNILKFDKIPQNLNKFYEFVKDNYNTTFFTSSLEKMDLFFKSKRGNYYHKNVKGIVLTTTRMTICEN